MAVNFWCHYVCKILTSYWWQERCSLSLQIIHVRHWHLINLIIFNLSKDFILFGCFSKDIVRADEGGLYHLINIKFSGSKFIPRFMLLDQNFITILAIESERMRLRLVFIKDVVLVLIVYRVTLSLPSTSCIKHSDRWLVWLKLPAKVPWMVCKNVLHWIIAIQGMSNGSFSLGNLLTHHLMVILLIIKNSQSLVTIMKP